MTGRNLTVSSGDIGATLDTVTSLLETPPRMRVSNVC
jgi:hypothetical protein